MGDLTFEIYSGTKDELRTILRGLIKEDIFSIETIVCIEELDFMKIIIWYWC